MPWLEDTFRPASGLNNRHAQTLFAYYRRQPPRARWVRQRFELADGDFVDLDVARGETTRPTLLLLHGLEGSTDSGYMHLMAGLGAARGWTVVGLNFRSCSGVLNRKLRSYSSGDFADVHAVCATLTGTRYAVGFSLGASVLLNYVARHDAPALDAAVGISPPFDLDQGATLLDADTVFSRGYVGTFLKTMKEKALQKALRFPGKLDAGAIARTRSIREFDGLVTAPAFGFSSAEHYYRECSPGPLLKRVKVPTRIIASEDDPIAPANRALARESAHALLHAQICARGGHNAFVEGSVWRPEFFAEREAINWLAAQPS